MLEININGSIDYLLLPPQFIITLNPVLKKQLPQLENKIATIFADDIPASLLECLEQENHARILEELLQLFSQEFHKYIEGALAQDWPFLPPTINPTMMGEPNPTIPKLNQIELLLLVLNSAFNNEDYRMALSIAFVIDRFIYYCDGSAALLKIVDCIRKLSPSTPVAPQLVIRSARVMKDNGDLHGSIQILNRLIDEKWEDLPGCNDPSRWQYKEEEQYINVAAVCVQIKGQIYHNLSLWKEAIGPLMKSIEGFNRLSVKDYKGMSYSYSLLSRCLCRLSKAEYRNLRQEYLFQFDNNCYQAYEFGMLAYNTCPGQRLFLSKHLLLSGECLLMYTVQLADEKLRYEMFLKILETLNLVFCKQNVKELSQSKDQLFNFIKSLFVTCLTFGCSANSFDRCMGNYLETICLFVYKKFCDIGANQLDSEVGNQNLEKIIPGLTFALLTISRQHPNGSSSEANDALSVANTADKTPAAHFPASTASVDPNGSSGEANDALSVANTTDKTTAVHFPASTDSAKIKIASVDPEKQGQTNQFNRNVSVADNAEHVVGSEKDPASIMRDASAEKRLQVLRKRTLAMGHKIIDDSADLEGLGTTEENIPMIDDKLTTQTSGSPMVDCDAITGERVVIPEGTSMVDCAAITKERMVIPEGSSMVDCDAITQERMVKQNRRIPLVDCNAVTQERMVMQEEGPIIVDSGAFSQKGSASFGPAFAIADCTADTQKRVFNTDASFNAMYDFAFVSDFDSMGCSLGLGFDSMGCSLPEEFWTTSVKPQRIVGLPSRVSMIESKVSALDELCQTFEDFIVDVDSSSMPRGKDASLVNTKALTVICQSKKDGTYLPNRLLNKFKRQETLTGALPLDNPITEDVNQVSLASFLGDLLRQNQDIISSLHSGTKEAKKEDAKNQDESINKVQKATLYEYNPVTCVWSGQDTIFCTGKKLTMGKGKKGQFRDVYQINYLHQEEPLGKYVSKRYRKQRESLQYMDDVVCQMQAGHYVNLFNQALKMFKLDLRIYFLNAAFMLLYDAQGEVEDWMNIEPFVDGEFIKLTSNYDFCDPRGKNVSTSFTHFTYVQSNRKMMVCDLQGWLPTGTQNLIYLTDPQFHTDSGDSSPFDFGQDGIKLFFDVVHPECNEICQILNLGRPTF